MEPWYKVATPRKDVREGRSFNPDEFAIALEQVVAGTAPEDYRDPAQFLLLTRHVLQSRISMGEPPKAYVIRVIVDVDRNPNEVVTAYRSGKMDKYWRQEP